MSVHKQMYRRGKDSRWTINVSRIVMDETGTKGQKYITVDADMDLAEYFL